VLKPLAALLQHLAMPALIDKGEEIREAGPHRHVHENEIVLEGAQTGSVSFFRLQAPHKARAGIRNCVDLVQTRYEPRHLCIGQGSQHTSDIDLSKLVHYTVPFMQIIIIGLYGCLLLNIGLSYKLDHLVPTFIGAMHEAVASTWDNVHASARYRLCQFLAPLERHLVIIAPVQNKRRTGYLTGIGR